MGVALVKWIGLGTAAALLATSMPAMARPRYGYPGYGQPGYGHGYPGYGYRRHHGDGFDFGDFLLGAVIAGGIAAVATGAMKNATRPGRDDRTGTGSDPRRDGRGATGEQGEAADACAAAAERQASRYASDARVTDISRVSRDGDGWRVEGVVSTGDERSYRDQRNFQCGVRYGAVDFVQLGDELAIR